METLPVKEKWCSWSIPFLFIIGSTFHFLFELSGNSPVVGAFAAINESVWEHQKMVLLPVIGWWTIVFLLKGTRDRINKRKWFTGSIASLIVSIMTIPFMFYFYSEAFGVHLLIVDVLILLLAFIGGQCIGFHFYKYSKGIAFYVSMIVTIVILLIFILFTFNPPLLPWFKDSLTGQYGI